MEASQHDEEFCVLGGLDLTLNLTQNYFLDLILYFLLFLDHLCLLYSHDHFLFLLYGPCPDPQTCCWCRRQWRLRRLQPRLVRGNWREKLCPARCYLAMTNQGSVDLVLLWLLLAAELLPQLRLEVGGGF